MSSSYAPVPGNIDAHEFTQTPASNSYDAHSTWQDDPQPQFDPVRV
jgi:hypothetical protein